MVCVGSQTTVWLEMTLAQSRRLRISIAGHDRFDNPANPSFCCSPWKLDLIRMISYSEATLYGSLPKRPSPGTWRYNLPEYGLTQEHRTLLHAPTLSVRLASALVLAMLILAAIASSPLHSYNWDARRRPILGTGRHPA